MINLRNYQQEALDSIFNYWASPKSGNPLVEMATGTGKSLVIAALAKKIIDNFPSMRIVILTHVKELVAQNFSALLKIWPEAPVGIYSAGLGKSDTYQRIIFASIQSVFRRSQQIGPRHLVIIDEAHLVPKKATGMYRNFLGSLQKQEPNLRVAGFTATPFRLDSGRLDAGDDRLFDKTVFQYDIRAGIADGFLSPLISKASMKEIDVSNVERRGGEFVAGQLATQADKITAAAVSEIISLARFRKSLLIFCSGVDHAKNVAAEFCKQGIRCEAVTGKTNTAARDSIIRRFKSGELRALTNANVLTTGFDAPNVDCIAMLRPTLSTSLYLQIVGRGTRLSPGKENCLVLDFAGNIRRHGPVDDVFVLPKKSDGKVRVTDVRAKTCPECGELVGLAATYCKWCGYDWPKIEKANYDATAENKYGILSTEKIKPTVLPVINWRFSRHEKQNSPDSLKVTYIAGIGEYYQWVALEHEGQAGLVARQWWLQHGGKMPFPKTITEAISRTNELQKPAAISVKKNGKYYDVVGFSHEDQNEIKEAVND